MSISISANLEAQSKKELDSKAEADVKTEFKDYKDDFKTELEDCKPEKKDFKTDIEDCDIKSEASTDDIFERNKENIDMKEEDTEAHSIKPKEESINVENPTILTNNETHLSSSPKRTSMSTQGTESAKKKRKQSSIGSSLSIQKANAEARQRKLLTCPICGKEFPPLTWTSELNQHIDNCLIE